MFDLLKKIFVLQFLFTISLTSITCKKSPVQPDDFERFTFTFEDASCTEAWFNLKLNNLAKPVMVNIYKDNFLDKSFNIYETNDTTFYIENLLPKKNYEVYVEVQPANDKVYRSNKLRFTTMDTTSHEFTWQSWEFGTTGSSTLYDVAIIDENDIWAVGEINIADSSINGYTTYNAVHWDGTKWELKRIPMYSSYGLFYPVINTIVAFNSNDIWFGAIHWDGIRYTLKNKDFPTMPNGDGWRVNKMWGTSSSDLYAVGNYGNIAHWDGSRWTKIESGTTIGLLDIWGVKNKDEIYTCGAPDFGPTILLKIKNNQAEKVYENSNVTQIYPDSLSGRIISGVSFRNYNQFILTTQGLYKMTDMNKLKGKRFNLEEGRFYGYPRLVRGNGCNDVFIVGDFLMIAHFNGVRLHAFREHFGRGVLFSVSQKGDIVIAVGIRLDGLFTKAYILKGKKI